MAADYVARSPAESRAIVRALEAGTPARTVVRHMLGTPEPSDVETQLQRKAPARPRSQVRGPLQRAAGAATTVIGAPARAYEEGPTDSALSRLFTAVVVGAIVLELASLASGHFFTIATGGQTPFPLQVTPSAQTKSATPAAPSASSAAFSAVGTAASGVH